MAEQYEVWGGRPRIVLARSRHVSREGAETKMRSLLAQQVNLQSLLALLNEEHGTNPFSDQ